MLHTPSNSVLALKIIPVSADDAARRSILLELKTLHESRHPGIVSFYGVCSQLIALGGWSVHPFTVAVILGRWEIDLFTVLIVGRGRRRGLLCCASFWGSSLFACPSLTPCPCSPPPGAFYREGAVHLALEFMDASLLDLQRATGAPLAEPVLAAISGAVLLGLVYLHKVGRAEPEIDAPRLHEWRAHRYKSPPGHPAPTSPGPACHMLAAMSRARCGRDACACTEGQGAGLRPKCRPPRPPHRQYACSLRRSKLAIEALRWP